MKIQHAMCDERTADSMCCAQAAVLGEVRTEHGFTSEVSAVYHAKNNMNACMKMDAREGLPKYFDPKTAENQTPECTQNRSLTPVGRVRGAP